MLHKGLFPALSFHTVGITFSLAAFVFSSSCLSFPSPVVFIIIPLYTGATLELVYFRLHPSLLLPYLCLTISLCFIQSLDSDPGGLECGFV